MKHFVVGFQRVGSPSGTRMAWEHTSYNYCSTTVHGRVMLTNPCVAEYISAITITRLKQPHLYTHRRVTNDDEEEGRSFLRITGFNAGHRDEPHAWCTQGLLYHQLRTSAQNKNIRSRLRMREEVESRRTMTIEVQTQESWGALSIMSGILSVSIFRQPRCEDEISNQLID